MTDAELGEMIEETSRENAQVQNDMHQLIWVDYPKTDEGKRFCEVEGKMDIKDEVEQFPELHRALGKINKRDHETFSRYLKYQRAYGRRTGRDYFQEKFGDKIDSLFREINGIQLEKGKIAVQLTDESARAKTEELEKLKEQYKKISGVDYDFSDLMGELFEVQRAKLEEK
jgi:hypothetical protein